MALVLAGTLGGLAGYAYYQFLQCDWMQYGYLQTNLWTADAGYTIDQWVYLWVATYCLPIAVIFLVSFASAGFHSLPRNSTIKLTIFYSLTALLVAAVAFSYILAADVLHCISYLCVSTVSDSATKDDDSLQGTLRAGQIFVGMIYFFIADFFVIVFTTYIIIAHYDVTIESKPESDAALHDLGADPLHPLYPFSLALAGNGVASAASSSASLGAVGVGDVDSAMWRETSPLLSVADDSKSKSQPQPKKHPPSPTFTSIVAQPYTPDTTLNYLSCAVLLLVYYPFLIFVCCALPTWWAYFTRTGIQSYQADRPSQSYGTYWSVTVGDGSLVLKLFPDIVMFYGVIYLVAATALLAKVFRPLSHFLQLRPVQSLPYLSVGDIFAGSLILALLIGVFTWFYLQHGWEQTSVSSRSNNERAARSMGQVANVVAGLLLLPVTRNSPWTWMLSLSREAVLLYHQIMGYALLLVVGAHMVLWWLVFIENNTFPHDILAVPLEYHADNFTVPLAQVTYIVMLIIFGVLTYSTVRRSHYKLFYYLHLFNMVVFLVMLWHATMSWYFLLGGLFLWAVDWYVRLVSSAATHVSVKSIEVSLPPSSPGRKGNANAGAVVALCYDATMLGRPLSSHPGQCMYINIPQLSPHDWHPFSLSSCPADNFCSHHIKVVGSPASWTSRLYALTQQTLQHCGSASGIVVNVEGPYGVPWDSDAGPNGLYADYNSVLLLAGGIGITALLPVYRQLQHTAQSAKAKAKAKAKASGGADEIYVFPPVTLVWVVSNKAEALAFGSALEPMPDHGGSFCLIVFVTGSTPEPEPAAAAEGKKLASSAVLRSMRSGRPNVPSLLSEVQEAASKGPSPAPGSQGLLVHVCGPESLVDAAAAAAASIGAHFKREAFAL